jgi:hypothetical protein
LTCRDGGGDRSPREGDWESPNKWGRGAAVVRANKPATGFLYVFLAAGRRVDKPRSPAWRAWSIAWGMRSGW